MWSGVVYLLLGGIPEACLVTLYPGYEYYETGPGDLVDGDFYAIYEDDDVDTNPTLMTDTAETQPVTRVRRYYGDIRSPDQQETGALEDILYTEDFESLNMKHYQGLRGGNENTTTTTTTSTTSTTSNTPTSSTTSTTSNTPTSSTSPTTTSTSSTSETSPRSTTTSTSSTSETSPRSTTTSRSTTSTTVWGTPGDKKTTKPTPKPQGITTTTSGETTTTAETTTSGETTTTAETTTSGETTTPAITTTKPTRTSIKSPTRTTKTGPITTTEYSPKMDINAIIAIIANLTYDYEWNLTEEFNKTLIDHGVPTCPTASTATTTTTTPPEYDFSNTTVVGKCFVCGLKTVEIPRDAYCADAFAGDFLPLVPIDPRARGQIASYRKYCRYLDVHNYVENPSEPRSIYGRFTGGCGVRWTDLSGVYTQRTCRARYRPLMGKHFASKRMAKLELALINVENGCIISPMATLLPLSRGISLYARFHACVCTGSWCNRAARARPHALHALRALLVLALLRCDLAPPL